MVCLLVLNQCASTQDGAIALDALYDGASLIVIAGGKLMSKQFADVVLEDVKVAVDIMAEFFLQSSKLGGCIGGVTLKLSNLFEGFERLFTLAVALL